MNVGRERLDEDRVDNGRIIWRLIQALNLQMDEEGKVMLHHSKRNAM
jgi:hypothetical protein